MGERMQKSEAEIKDLKKIISIQEKIIAANKKEITYLKNVNDYLFYKGNDDYSRYWSTKVHNKMLYTYANNLWKSWKIWKAGTEDVSK